MKTKNGISYFGRMFTIILALVFLCCMVSMMFAFGVLSNYAEQQIGLASTDSIHSISETMSVLVDGLKRDALHLTMIINQVTDGNISAQTLLSKNSSSILLRKDLYNQLLRMTRANTWLTSIYLYMENLDYVISSDSEFALSEDFSDTVWLKDYQDSDEMWMGVRTLYAGQSSTPTRVLTYIYPLSTYIAPNIRGLVVFNIKESALLSVINRTGHDLSAIVTLDGEIVCNGIGSNAKELIAPLCQSGQLKADPQGNSFITQIDGENTIVSYMKLGVSDEWILVRLSNVKTIYSLVDKSTGLLLTLMLFLFLGAAVIVWLLAKKLSLPITKLKEQLETDERFRTAEPNDIKQIEKALVYLQKEEQRLSHEVTNRSHQRKQRFAASLFISDTVETVGEEDSHLIVLCKERSSITLMLSNDLSVSDLSRYHGEELAQYQSLIAQMCIDALKSDGMEFTVLPMKRELIIVCHSTVDWTKTRQALLLEKLKHLLENVHNTLGFSYTIGISRSWRGAENAHDSYLEAREAARMKLLVGYRHVVFYQQVPRRRGIFFYPSQQEKHIFNAIAYREKADAEDAIHRFIDVLRKRPDVTVDDAMLVLHLFTGSLVRELNEKCLHSGRPLPEAMQILDTVYFNSLGTLDEVDAFLTENIGKIIDQLQPAQPQNDSVIDKIYHYINSNYTRDLSIEEIASHLGISYSYTRKIFKDNTSRSILDYINEKRIENAKELLKETNMSIREVAQEVGYNNEQSFCRCFKKYQNMLPSHYRTVNKSQE